MAAYWLLQHISYCGILVMAAGGPHRFVAPTGGGTRIDARWLCAAHRWQALGRGARSEHISYGNITVVITNASPFGGGDFVIWRALRHARLAW